jgi:hypothetical protein
MKALTLHQPYASAVALGLKTVETRGWRTDYRGPLAIHAAARRPDVPMIGGWEVSQYATGCYTMKDADGVEHDLFVGGIVATCRLADVVPIVARDAGQVEGRFITEDAVLVTPGDVPVWRDLADQRPWGDFTPGRWAWLLDDVKPTTERCPECMDQFDGRMPGHAYGSNWSWVPCRTCDGGRRVVDPVPARGRQGLWEWMP